MKHREEEETGAASGDGDSKQADDSSSKTCCECGCGDCCGSNDVKISIDFTVNLEDLPEGMGISLG